MRNIGSDLEFDKESEGFWTCKYCGGIEFWLTTDKNKDYWLIIVCSKCEKKTILTLYYG